MRKLFPGRLPALMREPRGTVYWLGATIIMSSATSAQINLSQELSLYIPYDAQLVYIHYVHILLIFIVSFIIKYPKFD